jgi:hypothetical protein
MLSKLEKSIKASQSNCEQGFNFDNAKATFYKLISFEKYLHSRIVECYVIPAISRTTEKFNELILDLEALSSQELGAINCMLAQIQHSVERQEAELKDLHFSMERHCNNLLQRLVKEEEQLLPGARDVLTDKQWFSIAVECMVCLTGSAILRSHIANS